MSVNITKVFVVVVVVVVVVAVESQMYGDIGRFHSLLSASDH